MNVKSDTKNSKVKLPYEILINRLVDGLETPDMVKQEHLPRPIGIDDTLSKITYTVVAPAYNTTTASAQYPIEKKKNPT